MKIEEIKDFYKHAKSSERSERDEGFTIIHLEITDLGKLISEIERLDHLHKLDHSLADQWQRKNDELENKLQMAEEALSYYAENPHDFIVPDKNYEDGARVSKVAREALKKILEVG